MPTRNITKEVNIGGVKIGGNNPIAIQSMTNSLTSDVNATISQIKELEQAGCNIVRAAIPDAKSASAIRDIKKEISMPFVADIHFDYKLAIESMLNGADKIRINPGNIGGDDRLEKVIEVAKERNIPIRVGVNSGSVQRELIKKYGAPTVEAIVESACIYMNKIESMGYYNLVFSLKSSSVTDTIESYKLFSKKSNYPVHIGLTEAGTSFAGSIKSSVALGILLYDGIGDTIRVSLTDDPVKEIYTAKEILQSIGLSKKGVQIISCPTCARTKINIISIAKEVEKATMSIDKDIKVAVMGCAVNGPGEAKEADIGIAGGVGEALLFKKGEIVKKISGDEAIKVLLDEIDKM